MPVRGQAKVTIAASGGTQDPETKDPAQDAWESLSDELDKIHGEYMIGGDFNAETEAFLPLGRPPSSPHRPPQHTHSVQLGSSSYQSSRSYDGPAHSQPAHWQPLKQHSPA